MSGDSSESMMDSPAIIQAYFVYFISQCCILGIIALVWPLELWGLAEYCSIRWRTRGRDRVMYRLRVCLAINGILVALVNSISLVNSLYVGMSAENCDLMGKAIAIVYFIGVECAYLFLLQKVKLVSKFSQNRRFKALLRLAELGLFLAIPAFLAFLGWLTEGRITTEGRCMQIIPQWMFWVFSGGNLGLSALLIYLFVTPLRTMAASTGISTVQTELWRIYWWNVVVSSLAVAFTSILVIVYGILHYLGDLNQQDELTVNGLTVVTWDSFILCACCRLTTFVWLPKRARSCGGPGNDGFLPDPPTYHSSPPLEQAAEVQMT